MPTKLRHSVTSFSEPIDPKPVQTGQRAFGHDNAADQVTVEVVTIEYPEVSGVCQKVESPRPQIQPASNSLPTILTGSNLRIHLAPQNSKTFRT